MMFIYGFVKTWLPLALFLAPVLVFFWLQEHVLLRQCCLYPASGCVLKKSSGLQVLSESTGGFT